MNIPGNMKGKSVSVRVSFEEKETSVLAPASATRNCVASSLSHSHSFSVPGAGLEPAQALLPTGF